MQSIGMVNDHVVDCFCHRQVGKNKRGQHFHDICVNFVETLHCTVSTKDYLNFNFLLSAESTAFIGAKAILVSSPTP